MTEDEITLEELSKRSGVEPRTLRSWVSEGLLSPPIKSGRGARYPAANADRALAVKALKDLHGLSFAEIGRRFMMASDEQIREWALEAGATLAARGSARDYLHRVQARDMPSELLIEPSISFPEPFQPSKSYRRKMLSIDAPDEAMAKPSRLDPSLKSHLHAGLKEQRPELASIERLILQLENILKAPAPRRTRGAIWTRISITPDLELSVRGALEPRERLLFEQLADQLRAILTGRTTNE